MNINTVFCKERRRDRSKQGTEGLIVLQDEDTLVQMEASGKTTITTNVFLLPKQDRGDEEAEFKLALDLRTTFNRWENK